MSTSTIKGVVAQPTSSDESVRKATGKSWAQWLELLDAAGAAGLDHKGIVELVAAEGIDAWWQQHVTVNYEKMRGLREKHETPDGYQVSKSKTVNADAGRLFDAWNDDGMRARWLEEPVEIRKATPGKSLRITWLEDDSHVDVHLYAKGEGKTSVSLQHGKLGRDDVERLKEFWTEALARLKETLEGQE